MDQSSRGYVLVHHHLDQSFSAAEDTGYEDDNSAPLVLTNGWLSRFGLEPKNLGIVEANNDSMAPDIRKGDSVVVDTSNAEVRDGNIYVIRYRHELSIKRLFTRYDGALIIRSENNSKYPEEVVPQEYLNVQVIGHVVWRAGSLV